MQCAVNVGLHDVQPNLHPLEFTTLVGWAELGEAQRSGARTLYGLRNRGLVVTMPFMRYRRARIAGGTYFFTVNLADRRSRLLVERVDDLCDSVRIVRQRHPFDIIAWVALPDHLHAIWTLPSDDGDFSMRWSLIKAGFSRRIERCETVRRTRAAKRERGIWQRRFWEHLIRGERDLRRHIEYVHYNPVKHGHVTHAREWQYSSIHRYIKRGNLPADWAISSDSNRPD